MIGVVKLLNGYIPVKTLRGIQMSGEPSIPPPLTLGFGRHKDQPLSQPYRERKHLLLVLLYHLSRELLARPTPRYIP